jgi:membrane-associated protease RseP (regulator of RpoE activity)
MNFPAAALRPRFTPRQGVLLALTFVTLSLAGGVFWEPVALSAGGWLGVLRSGAGYAAGTLAILGAHEMGHFLACRRYGIPATWPYFIPGIPPFGTFGAVIRIRGRIPDRRALFDVAAAGPIAGFAVALPLMAYGLATASPVAELPPAGDGIRFGEPLVSRGLAWLLGVDGHFMVNAAYGSAWFGMLVTALNLFPVGQLDGGHAVYALSRRLHRWVSWSTIAGLAVLLVGLSWKTREPPAYLLWLAILIFMRHRHPPLLDEWRPLDGRRRWVAVLLALLFAATFTPIPLTFT